MIKKNNININGFTLIELLAVITIMGILMMVAIPAVSNTINNSRKDTFASTAGEILNSIKTLYNSDSIIFNGTSLASCSANTYYLKIGTNPSESGYTPLESILDGGAKSSFGGADLYGYVKIVKSSVVDVKYSIYLTDSKHCLQRINSGFSSTNLPDVAQNDLNRKYVSTSCSFTIESYIESTLCTINV